MKNTIKNESEYCECEKHNNLNFSEEFQYFIKPYYMYWNVGAHIGVDKTLNKTIENGIDYGMRTMQIFLGNPHSFTRKRLNEDEISKTKKLIDHFSINFVTHYPYVASLCGSIKSLAWNNDKQQNKKTMIMLKELEYEINILTNFKFENNTIGVVIHPGSHKNTQEGLITIAKSINKINFKENGMLLLENCAGEGTKLCKNFKEIKVIYDNLNQNIKKNVGVCIDTAHIWGQGDYNISDIKEVDRMFKDFEEILGMNNFKLLHLNDSEVPIGAKKDRHASLGLGYIWNKSFKSLVHLLNKCKHYNIPIVLETPSVILDMFTLEKLQPKD